MDWIKRQVEQVAEAAQGSSKGSEDAVSEPVEPVLIPPSAEHLVDIPTPSICDLLDHGPQLVEENGWKATFFLHFDRITSSNIGKCKLLPREHKSLIADMHLGNRAAQFSAWRFSLLWTGVIFFAFITVMESIFVADAWRTKGGGSFFAQQIDPRYRGFFKDLHSFNWLQSIGFLVASIAAVICAGVAALLWKQHYWSRRWAFASWTCSYMPPFLLLLVIPYRNAVDFTGIQVQMCRDMLNLTRTVQLGNSLWPGKVGTLAQTLFDSYTVELPADFCGFPPNEWGSRIRGYLDERGFLARENGTCGLSDRAMQSLTLSAQADLASHNGQISFGPMTVAVGTSQSDCPNECLNCTSACLPHLMRLMTLASIHGESVLNSVTLGSVAENCGHCVSREPQLRCTYKCPEMTVALDRQAILGLIPMPGKPCFEEKHVTDFELLMTLSTQTAYWRMLVGTVYAALAFATLLPLAFSLMLGAAKGATIAKSLIPYSRVPTVVSTSAAVFTFPFVFMITILVQNVAGTWLTLVGVILVLIAFLASMKPGTLKAESTAEMQKRQKILGKVGIATAIIALIIFVVVFAVSDLASALYEVLKEQKLNLTKEDLRMLGSQTTWIIVNTVCNVFGKSLLSTVFFSDAVVSLMYRFHKGENNDPFSIQCARTKLVEDLTSVYPDDRDSMVVVPADEAPTVVTAADLADQNQAVLMARMKNVVQGASSRVQDVERVAAGVKVRLAARKLGGVTSMVAEPDGGGRAG